MAEHKTCGNCKCPLARAKDSRKVWRYGRHVDTVCLDCWFSDEYQDDTPLPDESLAERRQMGLTAV